MSDQLPPARWAMSSNGLDQHLYRVAIQGLYNAAVFPSGRRAPLPHRVDGDVVRVDVPAAMVGTGWTLTPGGEDAVNDTLKHAYETRTDPEWYPRYAAWLPVDA